MPQNKLKTRGKRRKISKVKITRYCFSWKITVENYKEYLIKSRRTVKLWLLYIYYVDVVKMFIRAEISGYWNLHVVAMSEMLNLFAATGMLIR